MDDEKLIALIQLNNSLYNKSNTDFKDVNKRERIWATISMRMEAPVDACQSRWRMLREKYAREKRNERIITPEENASRPKWKYMDKMAFLEPHIHPRHVLQCTRRVARCPGTYYQLEDKFIRLVEKHPHLYDKSRSDFKDDEKRRSTWAAVAKMVDRSVDFCEKFWASLAIKYRRERKRRKYLMEGRTNTPQMRKYDWPLFEAMSFMDEHISQRTSSTMMYEESQQSADDFLCPMLPLEVFISTQSDMASLASCSNSPSTSTDLQSREDYSDFGDQKEKFEDVSEGHFIEQLTDRNSFADQVSDYSMDGHSCDGKFFEDEVGVDGLEGGEDGKEDEDEVQKAVVTSARDAEPTEAATDEDVQFVGSLLCMFRRMKRRKKALCKAEIFRVMAEYESEEEGE